MSTISFANETSAFELPRTRLRMTARGRRVLTVVASLPIVAAIAIGAISGGAAIATHDAAAAGSFTTVTVMPGDTLWSIASSLAPEADPRDVIADIKDLNALSSSELAAGQSLAIPAQYDH